MSFKDEKHLPYFVFLDTLEEKGCPICNLIQKQVNGYFENLLYSGITSVPFKLKFDKTDGFCNRHTYQFADYKDGLAVAITYRGLFEKTISQLEEKKGKKKKENCLICDIEADAEKRYLSILHEYIDEPRLKKAFEKSSGLCMPHFMTFIKHYHYSHKFYDFHIEKFKEIQSKVAEYVDTANYTSENRNKFDKNNLIWQDLLKVLYGYRK